MKDRRKKAIYYMSKFQSLSNAAEMIRSHGEEGFSFEDKYLDKVYKKQNLITAKQLNNRAMKFYKKYLETGIDLDVEIDENY